MNKFGRDTIMAFNSPENGALLMRTTGCRDLSATMAAFSKSMERQMYLSNPLPSTTIADQVAYFNSQFLLTLAEYPPLPFVGNETEIGYTFGTRDDDEYEGPDLAMFDRLVPYQKTQGQPAIERLLSDDIRALNRSADYQIASIGNNSRALDEELLRTESFRKNESGIPNGIPKREIQPYRRCVDRDISGTTQSREYETRQRGYDMSSLIRKVDGKHSYS